MKKPSERRTEARRRECEEDPIASVTELDAILDEHHERLEALEEIKPHADNVLGALTDSNTVACGEYASMADGVRQLTRERDEALARAEKAEADNERLEAERDEALKRVQEYSEENDQLMHQVQILRDISEARERRADDYQQRFEALRGEVHACCTHSRIPRNLIIEALARHPMPKGER